MYLSFIAFIYFSNKLKYIEFLFIYTRTKLIHLHGVLLNDLQVYCLFFNICTQDSQTTNSTDTSILFWCNKVKLISERKNLQWENVQNTLC